VPNTPYILTYAIAFVSIIVYTSVLI